MFRPGCFVGFDIKIKLTGITAIAAMVLHPLARSAASSAYQVVAALFK
jgi:hypothetical protein